MWTRLQMAGSVWLSVISVGEKDRLSHQDRLL
ncbi:hypothetical protein F4693_000137 [Sphingomonas endophytica]|uniref:Uncharacterized protein n=1 Tax=Sphingomonas endophytica TaxID=869719 RepID=A0A7X0J8U1_9SPHN|nr:hypothetical protein [Sphingomonas endophytica]